MTTMLEAKNGMRNLATKAKETIENDALTPAEKRVTLDALETDLKSFSDVVASHEAAQRLAVGGESAEETKSVEPGDMRTKSIEEQIVGSDAYQIAAKHAATHTRFSSTVEIGTKTVATVGEGSSFSGVFPTGQGGAAVVPQFLPGIVDLRFRKLMVADLLAQGSTAGAAISYVKETAFQNNAAGVAEAGAKPQSDDTIARVLEQVGKIAHYMKTTDELVQDAPAYVSFLQNRLIFGVQLAEDGELLNGSGYPSVNGLLGRSGQQTAISKTTGTIAAPTLVIDAVYNMITNLRFNAFVEPDAIVVNPVDWQYIRLAKDANSQYFAGGPFTGAYGNGGFSNVDALWGLRVVITPAIAAGTLFLGGFQECAQIFRRQGVTIEMTNSNVDDFTNNLITVRAEERLALAVYRPGGFGKVTVTWA